MKTGLLLDTAISNFATTKYFCKSPFQPHVEKLAKISSHCPYNIIAILLGYECTVYSAPFKFQVSERPSKFTVCVCLLLSQRDICLINMMFASSTWFSRHQHDVRVINMMFASSTWCPRYQHEVRVINVMSASLTWCLPHQHEVRLINMRSASSTWCPPHQNDVCVINMRSASSTWGPPHQHDGRLINMMSVGSSIMRAHYCRTVLKFPCL